MSAAVIAATRLGAAHDGAAELVVTLRHAGGGKSEVRLDEPATAALLDACGAAGPEDLAGEGWERVRDALRTSWSRLRQPPTGNTERELQTRQTHASNQEA